MYGVADFLFGMFHHMFKTLAVLFPSITNIGVLLLFCLAVVAWQRFAKRPISQTKSR